MTKFKKIAFLFTFTFLIFTTYSQEPVETDSVYGHFLMINSGDTSKQFKLRDAGSYTLIYSEPTKDSLTFEKIYFANGNIRKLFPKYVAFDIRNETIEHNYKDGSFMNTQNDYSSFYYFQHEQPRMINLNNLSYIDYSSPVRSTFHAIGISTMIISAVTTFILAPALNVDFKHGTMNSTGYINTVKVGLIGFAVGFPISYFTRTKRYQLTNNKSLNDGEYWYLGKEQ